MDTRRYSVRDKQGRWRTHHCARLVAQHSNRVIPAIGRSPRTQWVEQLQPTWQEQISEKTAAAHMARADIWKAQKLDTAAAATIKICSTYFCQSSIDKIFTTLDKGLRTELKSKRQQWWREIDFAPRSGPGCRYIFAALILQLSEEFSKKKLR